MTDLPRGWVMEAHATSAAGDAFLRYRLPGDVSFEEYLRFRSIAARHRLAVSSPTLDPPLCPLPGETEVDALGPPAPVGWSVGTADPGRPEPETQLILHGDATDMTRALEAARRIGWRIVSEAASPGGDRFAVIASRGNALGLEDRLLVALTRLGISVGMVFPLASDAPAH